jgi:hypothetical protein
MRSETNNEWTEGSGEDPRRLSGSDVCHYTDNSQGASQLDSHSHSRDGSGARTTALHNSSGVDSGGAPRSGRGQRPSGLRVPDASPPPRLPAKYAAEMHAPASPAGHASRTVEDKGVPNVVYENDDVGTGESEEAAEEEDGWEDEAEEGLEEEEWVDDEEGEYADEEEEQGSDFDGGARALTFDSEEGHAESSQPAAFSAATTTTTSAATGFDVSPGFHSGFGSAAVARPKEVFGAPPPPNAFHRATPVARAGYSVGYTPADGPSSEEAPPASPPRTDSNNEGRDVARAFGGFGTSAFPVPAPGSMPSVFSSAFTAATAGMPKGETRASLTPAAATGAANPLQPSAPFPMTASTDAAAAAGAVGSTGSSLKTFPSSFLCNAYPLTTNSQAADVTRVDPLAPEASAETIKPAFGGVSTPGLPFQRTFISAGPNTAAGAAFQFGPPFDSPATATTKEAATAATTTGGVASGVGVRPAESLVKSLGQEQLPKPFGFPAPQAMEYAFGTTAAPEAAAAATTITPLVGGGFGTTATAAPAPRDSNPFAASFEVRTFSSAEKKSHLFPPTTAVDAASVPPAFAGFGVTVGTTAVARSAANMPAPPPTGVALLAAAKPTAVISSSSVAHPQPMPPAAGDAKKSAANGPAAALRAFTSLAHNPVFAAAQQQQQNQKTRETTSNTRNDHSTTSSPNSPQRPTLGATEARPLTGSQGSSSVDYSTLMASPTFEQDDDASGESGGEENDVTTVAVYGAAPGGGDDDAARKELGASNTPALITRIDKTQTARFAAAGRSRTVEDIFSSMANTRATASIVQSACEREEDRARPFSGVSSSTSPIFDSTGNSSVLRVHGTPLQENIALLAEKPAAQLIACPAKPVTPRPVAVKVTVTHVYNYSRRDVQWLTEPAGTRQTAKEVASAPSLEVALYCRPMLVHLPNPPLHTSLLSAAGEGGTLGTSVKATRFMLCTLIPAVVWCVVRLAFALSLLVLCTLVVDTVWREYPEVRRWVVQLQNYVHHVPADRISAMFTGLVAQKR